VRAHPAARRRIIGGPQHSVHRVLGHRGPRRSHREPARLDSAEVWKGPLIDSHRDDHGVKSILGNVGNIRVGTAELESGGSGSALLGTLNFASADVNPHAEVAFQLYNAGYADSVSVSFIPVEWELARDRGPGCMNVSSAELLEVSAVAVPSDINAKTLERAVLASVAGRATREDREIIARAQRGAARTRPRMDVGREERLRRAAALSGRIRRQDRATVLQRQGATGLSDTSANQLTAASAHHERAMRHHRSVSKHHSNIDDHVSELRSLHRKLTSTLCDLGVVEDDRVKRGLAAFDTHVRACRTAVEEVHDSHLNCGSAVRSAESCIQRVLTGAGQSEPLGGADEDKQPDAVETGEDRAARARRIRDRYR
jgi:hypothetical protein